MLISVTFSCGHAGHIEIKQDEARQTIRQRVKRHELCPACRAIVEEMRILNQTQPKVLYRDVIPLPTRQTAKADAL